MKEANAKNPAQHHRPANSDEINYWYLKPKHQFCSIFPNLGLWFCSFLAEELQSSGILQGSKFGFCGQSRIQVSLRFNSTLIQNSLKFQKLKNPKLGFSSPSLLPATFCKVLFNWSDANFRPKSLLLVLYSIKLVIHPSFGSFFPSHKSGQQLFYAVLKSRLENASSDQNFQTIESDNNAVMLW